MPLLEATGVDYSAISSALTSGMGDVVTNTISMAAALIPTGLSVFGIMLTVGYAKKLFKKITGTV